MNILVDAMGGDNAPYAIVKGCVDALNERADFNVTFIGDEVQICEVLSKENYDSERITIRHTTQIVMNEDVPTKAIREKKDSSMVVGFRMLKAGEGDVFVSAGSSGGLLVGATTIVKRLKNIDRPCLGSVLPTKNGRMILVDSGLNISCPPERYVNYARLGAAYMKALFGTEKPTVGLVNVGSEEEKGPAMIKEANVLFKESSLNYIGYLEGKDVFDCKADVIVTDGFTGNVMLKLIEGTAKFMFSEIKNVLYTSLKTKIGALFLKKDLYKFKDKMDPDLNGGAPILGVNGLVIKTHGSSNAKTVKHVIIKACDLANSSFLEDIRLNFEQL